MTGGTSKEVLREELMQRAARLAGVDRAEIKDDSSLDTLGLDSSDAVILAMHIEEAIGDEVEVGIFLRVATVGEAIDEIITLHLEKSGADAASTGS